MDWHQVRQLEEDLKKVRIFLFEVARKQPEIELWGLGLVNRIVGADEALALLRTIETRLSDFQSSVRYAAPEIFQKVSELLDNSPLYHRAAEFSVSIELEKHSKHPSIVLPAAIQAIFRYLNIRRERILDNDEGVPLRKIIVDLDRLLSLVSLGHVDKRDSHWGFDVIQAGICYGDQLAPK
ncbi:hypothetical protein, partial [Tritonibacter mobilis]|uniref:hypothetical protein n=1 Tax=Tritonibacter mobilis TaxID=379347 RepID=UPI0013A5AF91